MSDGLSKRAGISILFGAIGVMGITTYLVVKDSVKDSGRRAWVECQVKYADTNNDRRITKEEADDLYKTIALANGSRYIDEINGTNYDKMLVGPDGGEVGLEDIIEWCDNYAPANAKAEKEE